MTLDEVRTLIAAADWTQSKGYERKSDGAPVAPHQYVVRPKQPEVFAAVNWMLGHAPDTYRGAYGGYRYTYWNCDGWRYWTMGVILNRVPVEDAARDPMAADDPTAVDYLTGQRGE